MKRNVLPNLLGRAPIVLGLAASAAAALLLAGTPALATKPYVPNWYVVSGTLENVADETRAAGTWRAALIEGYVPYRPGDPRYPGGEVFYSVSLTVDCTRLTPGANYLCYAATSEESTEVSFVAKKNGDSGYLGVDFDMPPTGWPTRVVVEIYRVDGNDRVLVLE
jgi:hypothetical protein